MTRLSTFILMQSLVVWAVCPGLTRAEEFKVETRTLGRSLFERGSLVSLDSEPVTVHVTGDLLEIKDAGVTVKKDEVITRIDDTLARERLEEVIMNTRDAEQSKSSSEAYYTYLSCVESNRLDLLRKRLTCDELAEAEARAGLKPEDRRLLEIELEIANLDLLDARDTLTRQQRLFDKKFISAAMLEPYQRRVTTLEANVAEIEARTRLEEKGVPEEVLLELQENVARTRGMLERGEKAMARRLDYVQRQIDAAQARLDENLHDRRQIDDDLAATEIRASRSGTFSVRRHYEKQVGHYNEYRPGDGVSKYDRIADIVNPGRFKIDLMIHESDIEYLETGIKARILIPALPGQTFTGELIELGGVGRDRSDVAPRGYEVGQTGVSMFNASVSLESDGMEFRPGMSAIVELILEPPAPRTVIPRGAVKLEKGIFYVYRKEKGQLQKVPVQGRFIDEIYFVVEKGIREGDTVAATPPEEKA